MIRMLFLNGSFCREVFDYSMVKGLPVMIHRLHKGDLIDLHEFDNGVLVHVICLECEDPKLGKTKVWKEWFHSVGKFSCPDTPPL